MNEQTVVLIKPDGVQDRVIGKVISMFEDAGLQITALKYVRLNDKILTLWYAHHSDKPFFPDLLSYMQETPVVAMVLEGEGVIEKVFTICGPTDPKDAPEGTIRREFGKDKSRNVVHRSDSAEAARKEISLLFSPDEVHVF